VGLGEHDMTSRSRTLVAHSIFGQAPPAGIVSNETTTLDLGLQFRVTEDGHELAGYWWYHPVSGGPAAGSDYSFRLYALTTGTSGAVVGGSVMAGSGSWAPGTWHYQPLPVPVPLAAGTTYCAVCTLQRATYQAINGFWGAAGPGSGGVSSGPITAPPAANALGGLQQPFAQPATGNLPITVFNQTGYALDVSVTPAGEEPGPEPPEPPDPPVPPIPGAVIVQPDLEAWVWSNIRDIGGVSSFAYAAVQRWPGWIYAHFMQIDARHTRKQTARDLAELVRQRICALPDVPWPKGTVCYVQPVEGPAWLPDDDGSPRYMARYEIRVHPRRGAALAPAKAP
jgi:hypothetical protein